MNTYRKNDLRFPDGSDVLVRYPANDNTADSRGDWPWVRGRILGQTGFDEWHVSVQDRPDAACFRTSTELLADETVSTDQLDDEGEEAPNA